MDIHEYQAKSLLSGFGVSVPPGGVAYSPDQAVFVATELGGAHWAVKAQIHSGGRGKAGGVKLCRTYHDVAAAAKAMLGATLVTNQTGPEGKVVHRVYVEKATAFERELYLGFVLDRKIERIRVIASVEGGMEIDQVIALDAKMSFDDNALFRRPQVTEMRDPAEEDPREARAAEFGLNYVGLDGDIGCIINGAGLAMATMDNIKYCGGDPANFLDVGGGASPERVAAAFNLVLTDQNVKCILVNIFAGINRCDWVAQGVVQAAKDLRVPLVVRLAGTNVEEGQKIIRECGLPIMTADSLMEACEKSVKLARGELVN